MNKMQEKFQQVAKTNTNEQTDRWVSQASQRHTAPMRTRSEAINQGHASVDTRPGSYDRSFGNELPVGYDIDSSRGHNGKWTGIRLAGATDVSNRVTPEALASGFVRNPMSPVEDMYTDEHRDDFYDDVGGFVERANYLDRL